MVHEVHLQNTFPKINLPLSSPLWVVVVLVSIFFITEWGVSISDVQNSELLFNFNSSLIQSLSSQRKNISFPLSWHHIQPRKEYFCLCKWQTRKADSKVCGLLFSSKCFGGEGTMKKNQAGTYVCRCFLYPQTEKEADTAGSQLTLNYLFIW